MPPIWKGAIRFGLVSIPVALSGAETRDDLDFDLLDRRDLSRVGYETVNKATGRRIDRKDVVKGFEVSKGRYVTVSDDDFRRANVAATQTLDIVQFVERDAIDPRYFERPYFVTPLPRAEHAYALLREALEDSRRVGIARVVLRSREHLAALMPLCEVLICDLLRFAHELREVPKVARSKGAETKTASRERAMAQALIDSMTAAWRPEELHDTYREDLVKLLRAKAKAPKGAEAPPVPPMEKAPGKVIDLMTLLRQSVAEAGKPRRQAGRRAASPSRRPVARTRKTRAARSQRTAARARSPR